MQNFATEHADTREHILDRMNLTADERMIMNHIKFMAIENVGGVRNVVFLDCMSAVRHLMTSVQPMFLIYLLAPLNACVYAVTSEDGVPDFRSETPLPFTQQTLADAAQLFTW